MDAIDCDVHCAPASYDALFPYLSDYWRQYISEAGIRLIGLAHAYPRGVVAPAPSWNYGPGYVNRPRAYVPPYTCIQDEGYGRWTYCGQGRS